MSAAEPITGKVLRTRRRVMQRVLIDPVSQCWIWLGSMNASNVPTRDGSSVRREAYALFVGPILPRRFIVCGDCADRDHCINPAHAKPMTKREYMRAAKRRGATFSNAARSAKVQIARRKASVLSIEAVREIRARRDRGEALAALAEAYGTTNKNISLITNGRTWREPASPLALLAQQCGLL